METSIDKGNNIQVIGKSELTLPELFDEYFRLMRVQNPKVSKPLQDASFTASKVTKGKKKASVSPKRSSASPKTSTKSAASTASQSSRSSKTKSVKKNGPVKGAAAQ